MEEENRQLWLRELSKTRRESDRNWWTAFILSLIFGVFGIDRFYLGYGWTGMFKLLTFGGIFIWWVVDLVLLIKGKLLDGENGTILPPWASK